MNGNMVKGILPLHIIMNDKMCAPSHIMNAKMYAPLTYYEC